MSEKPQGTYRLPVTIRKLDEIDRSGHWLAQGWRDFLSAPFVSLVYGGTFVLIGLALTLGLRSLDLDSLILPLAGGFVILSPLLVVGLYDVSRRLESGQPVTLGNVFTSVKSNIGQLAALGVALLICYLVWVEIALVLFMGFFHMSPPSLDTFFSDVLFTANGALLLLVGSVIGAILTLVVFSITAVSVPLLFDRPLDVVTAISASLLAVRTNWRVMFGWAALIALIIAVGLATAFVGLTVAVPLLAYATWHCYRDVIEPETAPIGEVASPAY
jgi:uncharacterized membrane protein